MWIPLSNEFPLKIHFLPIWQFKIKFVLHLEIYKSQTFFIPLTIRKFARTTAKYFIGKAWSLIERLISSFSDAVWGSSCIQNENVFSWYLDSQWIALKYDFYFTIYLRGTYYYRKKYIYKSIYINHALIAG